MADDEAGLWRVWKQHAQSPESHAEVVEAADAVLAAMADDPLSPAVRTLAAWHLLKLGRNADAAGHLARAIKEGPEPLDQAAAEIARAWLTRTDIDAIKPVLREWYVKHVAYPETLQAFASWPPDRRPPLADRWGQPWAYRLADFQRLKGFRGQRYELQCTRLGSQSDLAAALARPYPAVENLRPVKVVVATRRTGTVRFAVTPEDATGQPVSVGATVAGLRFVYLGERLLVLADAEFWHVTVRPAG